MISPRFDIAGARLVKPLYNSKRELIGGMGQRRYLLRRPQQAWRTRNNLHLDHVPAGVGADATRPDNINDIGLVPDPRWRGIANDANAPSLTGGGSAFVSLVHAGQ